MFLIPNDDVSEEEPLRRVMRMWYSAPSPTMTALVARSFSNSAAVPNSRFMNSFNFFGSISFNCAVSSLTEYLLAPAKSCFRIAPA